MFSEGVKIQETIYQKEIPFEERFHIYTSR